MTSKDFLHGWALLVAQPYGAPYRKDADVEKMQRLYWEKKFSQHPKEAWQQAVTWWIDHQDHFPLIPEMQDQIRRHLLPTPVPSRPQLQDGVSVPVTDKDIIRYAIAHDIQVFQAVMQWEKVRDWVAAGRPPKEGA